MAKDKMSMVAFSGTNVDIDPTADVTPVNVLTKNVVDLMKQGQMQTADRIDPVKAFKFNDPLLPRQWHLVSNIPCFNS